MGRSVSCCGITCSGKEERLQDAKGIAKKHWRNI